MKQRKEKEHKQSFTKSIMSIVISLYLIGALLGTALVILAAFLDVQNGFPLDTAMFIAYATYLGGPTATAIIFYAWKSKAENVLKISQSIECDKRLEVIDIISKIGGI